MNGKELLLKALAGEDTSRPAWLPFVGCHGGFLINKTATEYLQSADLLVEGLKKAKELYRPDGLPVMFDLQIEAEILGCRLHWADEVPPAVISHPLAEGQKIADLPEIDETKGRFPIVVQALETLKTEIGDDTALYGLICGPFTLALHLLGNDIFLDMYDDEDAVAEVINYCAEICIKSADIYLKHGADVIAVVDPMTSQISPDHFEQFVTPAMNKVYDHIREQGGISAIFVCGDVTRNLEVMTQTTADSICVDEQIDMTHLRELCVAQGKSFGGNIKLTSVLLLGDENDAKMEVLDIMEKSGTKGFILAPGCDLPYAVPPENLQAVAEMVHDEYVRETARTLTAKETDSFDDIELPDYKASDAVLIDVITLDSTSCAPCQYMMEAVQKAVASAHPVCSVSEHKIKERRGIGMMVKLGVKNLPTICINGEVRFASIIPDQKTLVGAIEEAAGK
ncbi:uroporphyrinogen decarboxylase family protein [Tichowtungia aerotolerans]|uniref:Uroporphyrinogen decarboxylase n=1 Tax=Tichowtungia aerotolerans TaxID=2697043 RepID=A0A6P1M732_9BACT|nr:uroporphyrinogen decarboxylase family protein [Tichowtungia aerotolerans]QHI69667.1 uroporphyrinogen decarboxylase [Tichowtungia aerotolerans]